MGYIGPKPCQRCGKTIPNAWNNQKYCSPCGKVVERENGRLRDRERYVPKEPVSKRCAVCGSQFTSMCGIHKYCSDPCRMEAQREAGRNQDQDTDEHRERLRISWHKNKGKRKVYVAGQRAREVGCLDLREAFTEDWLERYLEFQAYTCPECGGAMTRDDASISHIYGMATLHGENSPMNTELAHQPCNTGRKHNATHDGRSDEHKAWAARMTNGYIMQRYWGVLPSIPTQCCSRVHPGARTRQGLFLAHGWWDSSIPTAAVQSGHAPSG